jgi:mono/diheme cytochrome c family protein
MTRGSASCLLVLTLLSAAACAGRGRQVFIREGCVGCHTFRDVDGGGLGPDLSEVATRKDAASIRTKITNSADDPSSRMPSFSRISWFDLRSLVAYLRA